jgi:undecaprenyl-phosphate 4-deoxy-4-formamido-L-arabinose transferase
VRERLVVYGGPYPYVDGLIFQISHNVGRLQVRHLPRAEGRTNYTLRRLIRLWLSMFLNFSAMPLRLATLLGLGVGSLGALGIALVLFEAIFYDRAVQGWASLMVAVLILSGVQLVILGVIGEYLGRMFLTTNQRPQYLVRTVFSRHDGAVEAVTPAAGTAAGGRPHALADRPSVPAAASHTTDANVVPLPVDDRRAG